jgi:hypothetical protein
MTSHPARPFGPTVILLLGGCTIRVGARPLVSAAGVPLVPSVCRDGGWQELRDDQRRPFENQGDCIGFVLSGRSS